MTTKRFFSLAWALLLGLAMACNGDENGNGTNNATGDPAGGGDSAGGDIRFVGDPNTGRIAAAELCDELADVMCNAEQQCCTNAGQRHADVPTCVAAELASCEADLQPLFEDPRTGYNATTAGQRMAELRAMAAVCDPTVGVWLLSDDGAFSILDGTVADSGSCMPGGLTDYAAFLSCDSGNACHVIVIPPSGTCGAPSAVGGACLVDLQCDSDLWCDGASCAQRSANGAACVKGAECLSLHCAGNVCADQTVNDAYCLNN